MLTYTLDGIPNDTLTSSDIGTRRFKVSTTETGVQMPLLYKRLVDNNGGTNMTVDGSVTPVEFYIQPQTNETYMIARWMLYIQDTKGFNITSFGANGTLVNGLEIQMNGQNILDYTIKSNGDIAGLSYDMEVYTFGNDDDVLVARWSFYKAGQNVRLTDSDRLSVIVNDDLTTISSIYIQVQGYKEI